MVFCCLNLWLPVSSQLLLWCHPIHGANGADDFDPAADMSSYNHGAGRGADDLNPAADMNGYYATAPTILTPPQT